MLASNEVMFIGNINTMLHGMVSLYNTAESESWQEEKNPFSTINAWPGFTAQKCGVPYFLNGRQGELLRLKKNSANLSALFFGR
jgi:hypothetical protein